MKESFSSIRLLVVVSSHAAPGSPTSVHARADSPSTTIPSTTRSTIPRIVRVISAWNRNGEKVRQQCRSSTPSVLRPKFLPSSFEQDQGRHVSAQTNAARLWQTTKSIAGYTTQSRRWLATRHQVD